jgi:hypothetical protein
MLSLEGLGGPGMSDTSGSYNAVTWLLDRNVDEGRANKLAYTDTVAASPTCCAGSASAAKSGWR